MTAHILTIITGASRGMGEALARLCLARGHQVLGMSRRSSATLAAAAAPSQLSQWCVDLMDAAPVAQNLNDWLSERAKVPWARVQLVNNAGVLAPLKPLSDIPAADTVQALRVGLEAPMLLTSAFASATEGWPAERRVLNVSSGLGRRAMAGSASYCAAKAGLDHFSRCLALEEAAKPRGLRVVSLAPGVIDTDMQAQLRSASPADFSSLDRFVQLKAQGQLWSAEAAALKLLAHLDRPDFGDTVIADVRDPQ